MMPNQIQQMLAGIAFIQYKRNLTQSTITVKTQIIPSLVEGS